MLWLHLKEAGLKLQKF